MSEADALAMLRTAWRACGAGMVIIGLVALATFVYDYIYTKRRRR